MTNASEEAGDATDDGVAREMDDIVERALVNDVLFKGLVSLLIEKGILSREEIISHLPRTSDVIGLGSYSRTALPRLKDALAFLLKD